MVDRFLDTPLVFLVITKDTHKGSTPSSKTQVLMKITNMDIWLIGTMNQIFVRGFNT